MINRTCSEDAIALDVSETKGMKLKKQHEVAHLSGYVYRECKRNNCAHVLDVGSGLVRFDVELRPMLCIACCVIFRHLS